MHVLFATMQSLCEMMSLPVPLSSLRINDQAYLVPRLVAEAILNTYEAGRALASAHPGIVHDTNRIAATPSLCLGQMQSRCAELPGPVALYWTKLVGNVELRRLSMKPCEPRALFGKTSL